jgi:hypothetical protein
VVFLNFGSRPTCPCKNATPKKGGGGVIDNLPEGRENAKYDILFIKRNMFLRIISSSRVILALIKSDNYIGSKYVET